MEMALKDLIFRVIFWTMQPTWWYFFWKWLTILKRLATSDIVGLAIVWWPGQQRIEYQQFYSNQLKIRISYICVVEYGDRCAYNKRLETIWTYSTHWWAHRIFAGYARPKKHITFHLSNESLLAITSNSFCDKLRFCNCTNKLICIFLKTTKMPTPEISSLELFRYTLN